MRSTCSALPLLLVALAAATPAFADKTPREVTPHTLAKQLNKVIGAKDEAALQRLSTPAFRALLVARKDPLVALRQQGATLAVIREELTQAGVRALLRCKVNRGGESVGDGVWLQLERVDGRWGLAGLVDVGAPASIWLQAGLKSSTLPSPVAAVAALVKAIDEQKLEPARATTTEHAWNEPGDNVGSLYRQAVRKRFVLKPTGEPRIKGDRAVSAVEVVRSGKVLDRVFLYLIKRGEGWLIDGIDEDKGRGDRFLAKEEDGKPQPNRPSRLATAFLAKAKEVSQVQSQALWTPDGWEARGQKLFRQRIAPRKANFRASADPQVKGDHAYAAIEQRYQDEVDLVFYLLMVKKPAGWRIEGWTKSAAQAKEHLLKK